MSGKSTGIEAMIALIVLLAFGSAFARCAFAGNVRQNAEGLAHTWTSEIYTDVPPSTVHVSCQANDTDNNGYVSCSVRVGDERLNLECVAYFLFNPGDSTCREVVPMRSTGRRQ